MNQSLKNVLDTAERLPKTQQDHLINLITDFFEQVSGDSLEQDLKDPEYRAYVEGALAEGEADIAAGRFAPIENVFGTMERDFKAKHGL